jgi:hypothetical protein
MREGDFARRPNTRRGGLSAGLEPAEFMVDFERTGLAALARCPVEQAVCLSPSGWAAGACGGAGGVPSVFGRTGAVTASTGDYTASQVGLGNVTNDAQVKSSQLVTTVGSPGSDANVPSEKAVRAAIPSVPVASVFGRTGAVTAASGDYAFGQISGSVAASQLPATTGDVNTTAGTAAATVVAIQGKPVANTSPVDGQMMRWNASAGAWQPVQVRYAVAFTSQTTVTVLGATHKLGTSDVTVSCISADIPPMNIEPDGWITDPVTFDVTIKFSVPLSGRCVLR